MIYRVPLNKNDYICARLYIYFCRYCTFLTCQFVSTLMLTYGSVAHLIKSVGHKSRKKNYAQYI